jgi:hypothetical protein
LLAHTLPPPPAFFLRACIIIKARTARQGGEQDAQRALMCFAEPAGAAMMKKQAVNHVTSP